VRVFLLAWNVAAPLAFAGLWALGEFWAGCGVLFGAHAAALFATLYPYCDWWGPQTVDFAPQNKDVWLTIDDGPDPEDTPLLLDALDSCRAKATFFVIGEKARRHPELIRQIVSRGHQVENHTLSHPHLQFWRLGPRALAREIDGGSESLQPITGQAPALFRAPVGMRNFFLHPLLDRRGLRLVGWTVRGLDGYDTDGDAIVRRILRDVRPGAIILMHESRRDANRRSIAAQCIPRVLTELTLQGYRFVIPPVAEVSDFRIQNQRSGSL
jgi:peptidoglycan/xylan/chitin deacetylase (PgdA/CDA1 family)